MRYLSIFSAERVGAGPEHSLHRRPESAGGDQRGERPNSAAGNRGAASGDRLRKAQAAAWYRSHMWQGICRI